MAGSPAARTRPALLLVDGSNLLFRAAYGFPRRVRSRAGADITPVFGFLALLRKAIRESGLTVECAVMFDSEQSWAGRQSVHAAYKSNRLPTPDSMPPHRLSAATRAFELLPTLQSGLDLLGVRWAEIDVHEADDAIATLATRALRRAREAVIFSPDRDFYQLLAHGVRIMNTLRPRARWFVEPGEIAERFGVGPHQWCDFRALAGDPSDGIPGVRGVGPIRAARFLADDLRLDDLPRSGRLTGRVGVAVLESWDRVLLWREVSQLRRDVPVDVRLSGRATGEMPKAAEVCDRLGLWD